MRFFGSRRFARSAPLAAAAILLCIGVFLPWLGSGPEAPGSLTGLHYSQAYQGTNGGGHTPTGNYLAALGDEAKDGDKGPVNAGLLTVLLVMFWVIVGWLLSPAKTHPSWECSGSKGLLRLAQAGQSRRHTRYRPKGEPECPRKTSAPARHR
jgi:hypothetical protein